VLFLNPRGDVSFWNGFMTVVPMVFGSALCMIAGSLFTRPPSQATIAKYFPQQLNELPGQGAKSELAFEQVASRGR
jgi:TorA maturation chaperone TorD